MLLLKTLLSHYTKHPIQGLFLLTGIVTANVLLVGTLLINAQARASYGQGEQLMQARPVAYLRAADGGFEIDERDYFRLRRQGFDNLAPVLRSFLVSESGQPLELVGIDVFAMPRPGDPTAVSDSEIPGLRNSELTAFALPPYQLWASPARVQQLDWREGDQAVLAGGAVLPRLKAAAGRGLGHRLVLDIGALQALSDRRGKLSRIMVFSAPEARLEMLEQSLPPQLELSAAVAPMDQTQLTGSFHLNLAAMGLLAFVVGVFLTYNAVAFSYTERRELIRRMKLCGVTQRELARSLLAELSLFIIGGVTLGYLLGSQLALWLLPGVGRTLAQLYGVYINYPDSIIGGGFALPLLMTGVATALCVAFPLRQAMIAPALARQEVGWQRQLVARRDLLLFIGGLLLFALALVLGVAATHWWRELWLALACMACLLLGAALVLPAVLRLFLYGLSRLTPSSGALSTWLIADTRWLLGPASLALMAMTLALVSNSGLSTMIGSFRQATDDWLQQRLVAQLYLRGENALPGLEGWLEANAGNGSTDDSQGVKISMRYQNGIEVEAPDGKPVVVEVISKPVTALYLDSIDLMRAVPDAVARFARGEGIYVSERAMRLDGWQPGDRVKPCQGLPETPVLAVYRSYGDPQSQWIMSEAHFRSCWPRLKPSGRALYGPSSLDWTDIKLRLAGHYQLDEQQLIDQGELKAVGMSLFDRTFQVTNALNALTLLVAGIGIFCSISAIHHHRLYQQALLTSLGVSRRERGFLLLVQWGLLGLLCVLLVWPLGTALAWVLAAVVTPVAFGWSFALQFHWQHYLVLLLLAFGCLTLAVLLPSLRLLAASPGELLRDETA
jgi:putative ABC transport system permease protein